MYLKANTLIPAQTIPSAPNMLSGTTMKQTSRLLISKVPSLNSNSL
ncbi:protein of unknown function [Candidatus Nitrosocaldus cavascurensis]|uniref:Uncharacterized protein n=1 Tax=Candidatus Nitrosocaldus cavascurensis TaxID=2058097 RepID=A0A2K5AR25_9ARCH|nr:protein of unknown function [Candidatus Nitrosocaldus cavascurensis]